MKKVTTILISTLFIFSCTEKNQEYYYVHLEEAKSKINDCEEMIKNAFKSQDEEKLKEVNIDFECMSARKAIYKANQEKNKIKREKRKEEERHRKIKEEKEYNLSVKGFKNKFNALEYSQLILIQDECRWGFTKNKNAKCDAFRNIFESKKNEVVNKISKDFTGQKLLNANKKWCKGIEFNESKCKLSKIALSNQKNNNVKLYLADRNKLKQDFNDCLRENKMLRKKSKFKEAVELKNSFRCKTVIDAAAKLKIFQFSKPIE